MEPLFYWMGILISLPVVVGALFGGISVLFSNNVTQSVAWNTMQEYQHEQQFSEIDETYTASTPVQSAGIEQLIKKVKDDASLITFKNKVREDPIEFCEEDIPLLIPVEEYHEIKDRFGCEIADQVTTTPAIGGHGDEVMIGRLMQFDSHMHLLYGDYTVQLEGTIPEREGIALVRGSFVSEDVFYVDTADLVEQIAAYQELQPVSYVR